MAAGPELKTKDRRNRCAESKRIDAMNDTAITPCQTEAEIPFCEVSDEALESAAGAGTAAANMTFQPIWCPARPALSTV